MIGRAGKLERLGLAEQVGSARWELKPGLGSAQINTFVKPTLEIISANYSLRLSPYSMASLLII